MNTLILTLTAATLLMGNPPSGDATNSSNQTESKIRQQVSQSLSVPEFCKDEKPDYAMIRFRLEEDGAIRILNAKGTDDRLEEYIKNRLDGSTIDIRDRIPEKTYSMKIDFRVL